MVQKKSVHLNYICTRPKIVETNDEIYVRPCQSANWHYCVVTCHHCHFLTAQSAPFTAEDKKSKNQTT